MSSDVTVESITDIVNSENNNYINNLKELDAFKSGTFCVSSDSDYIDSSRSNSIDSEKSTSTSITSQTISEKDSGINNVHKSNITTDKNYSLPVKEVVITSKNDENSVDKLDSGISSPVANYSENLNLVKKEKSCSFKEKFNENNPIDMSLSDCSGPKVHNSKFQFRLPKLHPTHHNSSNIGGLVNRIRSLSISMAYSSSSTNRRASGDGSLPSEPVSLSPTTPEIDSDPAKLPKEHQNTTINFTSKNLRSSRKWLRMTHSLSCDAETYVHDFAATQNKLEKYLSSNLDSSTPSGALLKVINQGLRKVSESDRYLLFSKSPLRSPIDFLESGIEHLGDTEMLITILYHSTCYDLMPESGKLVVLDSRIQISKAFIALVDNNVDSAPIWCNANHAFCGMLTKEDQIHFLSLAHQLNENNCDVEKHIENLSMETIENCIGRDPLKHELQLVYPEHTVALGIKQLEQSPCNKVLVLDQQRSGNGLFVLDHGLILSFLLNVSKAGLPLPSVLKTTVGVTELMLSRKLLSKYQVFMDTSITSLLEIMNDNPHHCALVCVEMSTTSACSCNYDCKAVITVDHITHLISTSKFCDPTFTVQSMLLTVTDIKQKFIRCSERDSVIDIIKRMNYEKASFALINQTYTKQCVHSIISSKELLDYIMKHDHNRSPPRESVFAIDKTKCFRTISCCEDSQRINDINLSEVSLDEKDEDVFNMEMT